MPHTFVIFGASGDLTQRKLVPALYQLFRKGRLPKETRIVGFSRTAFTHETWRAELAKSTAEFLGDKFDAGLWDKFSQFICYHPGDIAQHDDVAGLARLLDEIERAERSTRVYYLATAPRFYETIILHLGRCGLADESRGPVEEDSIVVVSGPGELERDRSGCEECEPGRKRDPAGAGGR